MRTHKITGGAPVWVGLACWLTTSLLVLGGWHVHSAALPTPPLAVPAPTQDAHHGYDKPIFFFEAGAPILVFYPNGDILHRGRKVTTDRAVVQALQEILGLSPCRPAE